MQPQTRDTDGQPGEFEDTITGECFSEALIVPLAVQRGRSWFPEGAERPQCWSLDAEVPADRVETPVCKDCLTCPKAVWGDNKQPPECRDQYNLMALRLATEGDVVVEMPFVMTIKGSSIKAMKSLITFGKLRGLAPYEFAATMRSFERRSKAARFYVVDFSGMGPNEPRDKYAPIYQTLTGHAAEAQAKAVEADDLPF